MLISPLTFCTGERITSGEELVAVNGKPVTGFTHAEVVALIGSSGDTVELGLLPRFSGLTKLRHLSSILSDAGVDSDVKSSLIKAINDRMVPLTTRPKRDAEEHGREYQFVSRGVFQYFLDHSMLLEWLVHLPFDLALIA